MSSSLFEIVELPNGEYALRRPDSSDEPFVVIRFSDEAKGLLNEIRGDVAKTMIEAGIEYAESVAADEQAEEYLDPPPTIH